MGVVAGPGVVERQDHATSAELPRGQQRTGPVDVGDGEPPPAAVEDFRLAGEDGGWDRQPAPLDIDPVPAEHGHGGGDGARARGPQPPPPPRPPPPPPPPHLTFNAGPPAPPP